MSGTHVFYNGVELRDCDTKAFDQKVTLDESKNLLTSEFRIHVESTVFGLYYNDHPQDLYAHPSTVVTTNTSTDLTATDRMHTIQKRLSQPRKDFWYATHGGRREDRDENIYQILVAATGDKIGTDEAPEYFKDCRGVDIQIRYQDGYHISGGNSGKLPRKDLIDVENGPIPESVRITQVFGGRAFRISFEIKVMRHLCLNQEATYIKPDDIGEDDNPQPNEFIISNTWSTEETCDEAFRRSKVVEGTLRVRDKRYWAQGFRSLCLPGLLPGYRRMSQRFASDPTNLILKYRIEDKQAEAAPPWPCVDWVMTHTDVARNNYGMITRQFVIKLIGMPKATKANLIGLAINILNSRLPNAVKPAGAEDADFLELGAVPFFREGMVITQSSDKPEVELLCDVRMHAAGYGAFEGAVEASSQPLSIDGYNPDSWPAPRPYDADSPAGIFACYLQSPCNQWHGIPESQQLTLTNYDTDNYHPVEVTRKESPVGELVPPKYWDESDYEYYESETPIPLTSNPYRIDHIAYPYTHVEIDSRYENSHGQMVMPYSSPRNIGTESEPKTISLAVIPIHAGVQTRTISCVATRHGRPPEIPEPAEQLIDPNGIAETLIGKSEIVLDAPQSSSDQTHRVFSIQSKFTYALARPLKTTETYRSGNSPALISAPADNMLSGAAFFSRGRIEYHTDSYGVPVVMAPIRPPGINPATGLPWQPEDSV